MMSGSRQVGIWERIARWIGGGSTGELNVQHPRVVEVAGELIDLDAPAISNSQPGDARRAGTDYLSADSRSFSRRTTGSTIFYDAESTLHQPEVANGNIVNFDAFIVLNAIVAGVEAREFWNGLGIDGDGAGAGIVGMEIDEAENDDDMEVEVEDGRIGGSEIRDGSTSSHQSETDDLETAMEIESDFEEEEEMEVDEEPIGEVHDVGIVAGAGAGEEEERIEALHRFFDAFLANNGGNLEPVAQVSFFFEVFGTKC
ncbi:unnamed protein product [Caenorhabditis angaria]|uniref:Uncharacterized protein n=1 Tax=Caenorhabditis angaria TaxID=860376 RepID=A0A9P1N4R0_9PELO|nr:unnamed protein product [Caenorhabditis angaria]